MKTLLYELKKKIFNELVFPEEWKKEKIDPPNMLAKQKSYSYIEYLFKNYNMYPERIAPTKETGVFFIYFTPDRERSLSIEVYNDYESVGLVADEIKKEILYTETLDSTNFVNIVKIFNEGK